MINYTFTPEDIEKVEKFIEIKNKGWYADGAQLTEVYNRVLHKSVNVTQCGSCLRQRVGELEDALNHYKKTLEASKLSEVVDIKEAEKEEPKKENKKVKK